MKSTPIDQ